MRVIDTIRKVYEEQSKISCDFDNKYQWFAKHVIGVITFDDEMCEQFGWTIVDVCKAILDKRVSEYTKDPTQDVMYTIVYNLLNSKNWVEITATYNVNFVDYGDAEPLINWWYWDGEEERSYRVAFSEKNLRSLIEFIEEE